MNPSRIIVAALAAIVMLMDASLAPAQPAAGTVLWSCDEEVPIRASPALAADGTVYAPIPTGLCAITNFQGIASNKWVFPAGIDFTCPAIGSDGTIYEASGDGNLYAINPNGTQQWSFQVGAGGSPAIGPDGTIYIEASASLYAIERTGSLKWMTVLGGHIANSPVIGPDGTIYACAYEAMRLYAFNPDGSQRWLINLPNNPDDSPAIGLDGTIYVTAGVLYAFAPHGTQIWSSAAGFFSDPSPILDVNGNIYVKGFSDHMLYAISPPSTVLWQAVRDLQMYVPATAPAIDSASNLFYCSSNSIWALNPQGQVLWTVYGPPPAPGLYTATTSPIVGADGTVYVAFGTKVCAIASGGTGPANSSWPMYRQNARHTGKIEKPWLTGSRARSDSNFEFQLYANELGRTYAIETSTNLSAWQPLTNVVATKLPTQITDLTASNAPVRFYRATAAP